MRVAGIRELRVRSTGILGGGELVLVTRHGNLSGLYLPLDQPDQLPNELRRELASVLGRHLARALDRAGVSEAQVAEDFRGYRKRRR